MGKLADLGTVGMVGALLAAGMTGCGQPDADPAAGPTLPPEYLPRTGSPTASASATQSSGSGVTYRLPPSLCSVTDVSPLLDVFPRDGGKAVADSSGICATSRSSATMAVNLMVDSELLPNAEAGRRYLDTGRRLAKSTPTDIAGVGSGAFWTGDQREVKLVAYDGNLVLTVTCSTIDRNHQLPSGMPERLGRVAAGTFARLAS
ncbi:hypothetical protein GCM10027290_67980 [Micromonospora sonneratiae]|uniref:DUF3558 domain-containing protein n=1 Tax=Micromonospora sonneratiae TaxID=1184706 RepID=A0ABW3YNV5_9ACTN